MRGSIFNPETQNQQLSGKIVAGMERMSEAFRVLLWDHAKVNGLSPIQIQILIFIAYHPERLTHVSHLAREFNVSKPTMSEAIRVLDKKELIEKVPSPVDRRSFSIKLSEKGRKMVQETDQFAQPIWEKVNLLQPEVRQILYSALAQIIYDLHRTGILQVQRTCKGCRFYQERPSGFRCRFLQRNLQEKDLRIDCPEFEEQGGRA